MRHDRERVQVDGDRDRAHRHLRRGEQERRERREPHAARQPCDEDATPSHVARTRQQPAACDDAVPELHPRVEPLLRVQRVAAARPVLAAEARPVSRTNAPEVTTRKSAAQDASDRTRNARARREPARARNGCRHQRSTTGALPRRPPPPSRSRASAMPAAANVASSTGALLAREGDEQARRRSAGRRRAPRAPRPRCSRRAAPAKSRLRGSPPVRTPSSASSSAPGSAGSEPASSTTRTPLRDASSCACPSSPKPGDVGDRVRRERPQRVGRGAIELDHGRDRGLERALWRDPVPHGLEHDPRSRAPS